MSAVTITLDLAVPAPIGQRLDCGHVVAEGKPVYPRQGRSFCSPLCKQKQSAREMAAFCASLTRGRA